MKYLLFFLLVASVAGSDVQWQDDGKGAYAKSWKPADAPQPDASLAGKDLYWTNGAWQVVSPTPQLFENGIAVKNGDHYVELTPLEGDGSPVVALRISNSPVDPKTYAKLKADAEARYLAKQAADKAVMDALKAEVVSLRVEVEKLKDKVKP